MKYWDLRSRQQAEFDALPIGAAFSDEQFTQMMREWGLEPTDTDKIYSLGYGAFYRREDAALIRETAERHANEMDAAMLDDDFMIDAIEFELGNHEYIITYDPSDALDDLGLSLDDERVRRLYSIARRRYLSQYQEA